MPPAVSISQLESHLWEATNILRGPVDAADFKSYVFPLLFFNWLSDVHNDELSAALKAFDGDEEAALFPENYGFQNPEGCHWDDVCDVATNVGQTLQTALCVIEQANPHTLYGIFGDAQWTNKDRLSDTLLRDLIECVLGLGPNLFYNSPMEACVVVCRTQKPKARCGKILFINAVNEVTRERAQSLLTD